MFRSSLVLIGFLTFSSLGFAADVYVGERISKEIILKHFVGPSWEKEFRGSSEDIGVFFQGTHAIAIASLQKSDNLKTERVQKLFRLRFSGHGDSPPSPLRRDRSFENARTPPLSNGTWMTEKQSPDSDHSPNCIFDWKIVKAVISGENMSLF